MKKAFLTYFVTLSALTALSCHCASAQRNADSLRKAYDFKGAVAWCEKLLENADSTRMEELENELALSQNGLNMTAFCSQPQVVAKYNFPVSEFFLFYPLENHSWRPVPNQLDSLDGDPAVRAMYFPEDAGTVYYSAKDGDGIRNIYRTRDLDSLWSAPELINEQITSSSDEIFPMLSPDGKSMYFASKGLYGMGGYDLYVSQWNEAANDWDTPVNMGFPYSSPFDDFLYINTDDGRYTIFASNRECQHDSVTVYVLDFDSMPVRRSVGSVDELKTLASLTPQEDNAHQGDNPGMSGSSIQEDENVRKYQEAMVKVRELRDSISSFKDELDKLRSELMSGEAADAEYLKTRILEGELALPTRQAGLDLAVRELQAIEMDFLMNGIVIDPDKLKAEADREVVGASSSYVFSKNEMGSPLNIRVEVPEKIFDYTFKIMETGQFAEDNTLPDGIIYQIQLFASVREATVAEIKGLSPVFSRKSNGKNVYSVGLFKTYSDVLASLNKVKKQGFKSALITAFNDGKLISVTKARSLESLRKDFYCVRIIPADGEALGENVMAIIKQMSDKDITRTLDGTKTVYEVGPFDSREKCEEISDAISAASSNSEINISKIETTE